MDLKSLNNFIMSFDQFQIHWRFDDDSYNQLNQIHLDQIKPMTPQASNFLWNYSSEITKNLIEKKNFNCFREINTEDETIKKWFLKTAPQEDQAYETTGDASDARVVKNLRHPQGSPHQELPVF